MLEILGEQVAAYRTLNEIALAKQKALVDGRIDDLMEVMQREEVEVARLQTLEDARYQQQIAMGEAVGLVPDDVTVTRLIEILSRQGGTLASSLRQRQEELLGVMAEVSRLNELNGRLIQQSLAFVNFSLDLLLEPDTATYGAGGRQQHGRGGRARLVNRQG